MTVGEHIPTAHDASKFPTPKRYVFLLLPGFSHLSFTCALEALSLANYSARDRNYYDWTLVSDGGAPVAGWNGVTLQVDSDLFDLSRHDTLVVCSGLHVTEAASKRVLNWLRRETRKGMDFGAMNSGAYVLALAGLVDNKRVTAHWEYHSALTEMLPDVQMQDTIYTVDGRIFTCISADFVRRWKTDGDTSVFKFGDNSKS